MNPNIGFYDNLIDFVDPGHLRVIGMDTVEFVTEDDESRAVWKRIVNDCSDYLGMSRGKAGGGQTAPKDTNLYGPSLRKAVLTMSSKIHQTLFPAGSFVRSSITGASSREIEERAERIEAWFNHYLFDVLKGYKSDKELLVLWYVICGSAFSKSYIDPVFRRPVSPYVHPEDLIISPDGSCLEDAERITHQFRISEREYYNRVRSGMYIDAALEQDYESTAGIQDHARTRSGIKENQSDDKNKTYVFYESMRWLFIPSLETSALGGMLPYMVTVDRGSQKVIRLVRNYDPTDPLCNRKNCYTQYKLFPGFGPYGMGMAHLTLDLAKAETQTLNELIRAAELSNQPSLLQASGGIRKEATQINMNPGSINRVDTIDGNIGNAIIPLPFKEPSQTLFNLMQSFGQSISEISAIRELRPDDVPPNATATTMMGILSTMHIMEDAVINRLYDSFKGELAQFYSLFSDWLPDAPYPFSVSGNDQSIMRNDFRKDVVIQPIIDPNVSSQAFQLISNDTLLALSSQSPDLYNLRAVHERSLRSMRISEIDTVLKPEEDESPPPELDPVTENQRILRSEPIQVFVHQDHPSHITVHQDVLESLQLDESKADMAASLQSHINAHIAFGWSNDIQARMQMQIPEDPTQIPPEYQNQIAAKAAQAVLQKQQEEQAANPPPPDPSVIMMEDLKVKQAQLVEQQQSNSQKFELDQMKMELDRAKTEQELILKQREFELDERKLQLEVQQAELKYRMEVEQTQMKMQMESQKEEMRFNIERAKLQQSQEEIELNSETKAFDSTLRFESSTTKKDS